MRDRVDVGRLMAVSAQLANSAANLLVQAGLAFTLTAAEFGNIVVGLSLLYLGLGHIRAMVGDTLASVEGVGWTWAARRLVVVSSLTSGALVAASSVVSSQGDLLLLLAAFAPVHLANDVLRYWFWSAGRTSVAMWMDGCRLVAVALGLALALVMASPVGLVVAWSLGSGLATGFGLVLGSPGWRRDSMIDEAVAGRISSGFLGDQAPAMFAAHVLPIALAAIAEPSVAGAYRAALLPFMFVETVLLAVRVNVLRADARERGTRTDSWHTALRYLVLGAGLGAPLLLMVLDPIAQALGESGQMVGTAFILVWLLVVVRASGRAFADEVAMTRGMRGTAPVRVLSAIAELGLSCWAALRWGLAGVLIARIVIAAITTSVWILVTRTAALSTEGPVGAPVPRGGSE